MRAPTTRPNTSAALIRGRTGRSPSRGSQTSPARPPPRPDPRRDCPTMEADATPRSPSCRYLHRVAMVARPVLRPEDDDLAGCMLEQPGDVLAGESFARPGCRRNHDPVEPLVLEQLVQRVPGRTAGLDARVHRYLEPRGALLDQIEQGQ